MKEPSLTRKIVTIAGILVSFFACLWLLSQPVYSHDVLPRLGFLATLVGNLGILIYCWSAILAYIATKRNWSPRVCNMTGISFLIPAILLVCLATRPAEHVAGLIVAPMTLAGYLCRRFAYPEMSDEEANAPEPPLRLFPKS
jgi:hypothetical protein